ncbi:hypothetical protein AAC387_Pa03g3114 [Persea americana]
MWMMGCSDGSSGLQTSDSFNGRKLRPLIPRPTHSTSTCTTTRSSSSSSCFNHRIHNNHNIPSNLFALHNHLGTTEQGKREASSHPVSSRWNPTPEQLRTLEDLYRRGTRTPTAEQIQHITAQLRRYGKIEGKNVFYWFQNHKARERQKRRRQIEAAMALERDAESLERKDSAMSRTEGCKSWTHPINYSILAEESASLSTKGEKAREGWLQCNRQLHHQSSKEENATWHLMHFSSLPHLINTTPFATTIPPTSTIATRAEVYEAAGSNIPINGSLETSNEFGQSQTLELFPLRSNGIVEKMPPLLVSPPITTTSSMDNLGPSQFFHFL